MFTYPPFSDCRLLRNFDKEVQEGTPEGVERMKSLFDRALTACGAHVTEGERVWRMYLDHQKELLAQAPGDPSLVSNVEETYTRWLKLPLAGSAGLLEEYKAWKRQQEGIAEGEEVALPRALPTAFQRAQRAYELREPFEQAIEQAAAAGPSSSELLSAYMAYIKVEESGNDAAMVQAIYERAIAAFPVTHVLWLQYGRYCETAQSIPPQVTESVYRRGTRNCPWVGEIWARLLRLQERTGATEEQHAATYAAALHVGLGTGDDCLAVVLARADALRRRGTAAALQLRTVFTDGSQLLASKYPDFYDLRQQLTAYWARWEASGGGGQGVSSGRQVWDAAVSGAAGRYADTWLGFAAFEQRFGDNESTRAVFERAMQRKLDAAGLVAVAQAWIQFEREHGSAEEHLAACIKAEPVVAAAEAAAAAAIASHAEGHEVSKPLSKEEAKALRQQKDPNFKRPRDGEPAERPAKKAKAVKEAAPQVAEPAEAAEANGRGPSIEEQSGAGAPRRPPSAVAFVKHLADDVDEAALRELFASCGEIINLFIKKDKDTGRSRGCATIYFTSKEGLDAACRLDKTEFHGKVLFVAPSAPPNAGGGRGGRGGGRAGGRGLGYHSAPQGGREGGRGRGRGRGRGHDTPRGVLDLSGGPDGAATASAPSTKPATAFVPRAAAMQRPAGEGNGGLPKSNADFREMLLKK